LPPGGVLAIPGYGLAEAGLEADFGVPDEVALDLGVVQGVAEVVAGAVGDEGEEGGGRGTGRVRRRRTEDGGRRMEEGGRRTGRRNRLRLRQERLRLRSRLRADRRTRLRKGRLRDGEDSWWS
jgi:hypothetical protein